VAQAVWTGQLSFGLVNIPIKLYSATAPKSVRFHQYDAQTGRRIRYRRVAEETETEPPSSLQGGETSPEPTLAASTERTEARRAEREVQWSEVVKGFEIEPGRIVTVTAEELEPLVPEQTRSLEVEQFVPLSDIDPVYFDKSYYVAPGRGVGTERPYWLLYRALEAGGEVAVGRFVMRTKEYLAVVRPAQQLLMLETMFYPDEVRDPKTLSRPPLEEPPERELAIARQFIEALAGAWDPERHRDQYRERVLDLLRAKAGEAQDVVERERDEAVPPVVDLIEALKASVEAARQARTG
jgi:DNA end-binding protein Ku